MNLHTDHAVTRPVYWSVRREVWENRSIYIAPFIVAIVVLIACMLSTVTLPRRMRSLPTLDPAKRHAAIVMPIAMAPAPIMFSTLIVAVFYCLDALHGERRDRSILFWKSLPISDRMTVLSKTSIPLVVLPLIAYALCVVTQVLLLQWSTIVLLANGLSPEPLWAEIRFFPGLVVMIYGLTVHALWFAPIYGWLLMVSGWARRAVVLWAVLPFLAIAAAEAMMFNTTSFLHMLAYRVNGAMSEAFVLKGTNGDIDRLSQLDPLRFLRAPGLWVGLVFAALCVAAAVRLRRYREPI